MRSKIEQLISNLKSKKNSAKNEQATKQGIILPFFNALGYDSFNTDEIIPEYEIKSRRSENVDYAIVVNKIPIMIIECKHWREKLKDHWAQLDGYFRYADGFHLGILTNGIHYQFFSDFEETNKMDKRPFLDFNLERNPEQHFDDLEYFRKDKFDYYKIRDQFGLKAKIMSELRNPSEDFVKLFIKGTKTTKKINEKRPIVKKILNEILGRKIKDPPPEGNIGKIIVTEIPPTAQSKAKIKVVFPDGTIIQENKVINTYVKSIEKIGFGRVNEIGIIRNGINIVSKERHPNKRSIQKYIPEKQYYIHIHSSTDSKLLILNQIVSALNI